MAVDIDADQLREQANACRRIAMTRGAMNGGTLLSVAHYFEAHARRIERLQARGW